jgi:hypothetical protein
MADHQELIKEHLGKLGLGTRREEEILRELGEHLQDHVAALEAGGMAGEEAAREALDSVSNWPELRNEILAAETEEENMNYRTKVMWLPALCTFTLSMGLLALLQVCGLRPSFFQWSRYMPIHIPWLIALPIIGAIGAYWSKRAGGGLWQRLLVSQAPTIFWFSVLLVVLAISLVTARRVPLSLRVNALVTYIVAYVLLPSLALFIGAAPFLREQGSHQSSVLSSQ